MVWLLLLASAASAFVIAPRRKASGGVAMMMTLQDWSILDQAVKLYSSPSLNTMGNTEIEQDIIALRQREITCLVEDIASTMDQIKDNRNSLLSPTEIIQKLDEAVMDAVANDRFDDETVVTLAAERYKLLTGAPLDTNAVATVVPRSKTIDVAVLQARLEQLKVVVAPEPSASRLVVQIHAGVDKEPSEDEDINTIEPVRAQVQAATPVDTAEVVVSTDSLDDGDGSAELIVQIQGGVDKELPEDEDINTIDPVRAQVEAATPVDTAEVAVSTDSLDDGDGSAELSIVSDEDLDAAADVIAAVITAGAMAAAIVTKLPVIAAGAALAPAVSSALSATKRRVKPRVKPFYADEVEMADEVEKGGDR